MGEVFLYERNPSKDHDLNFWLAFPGIYSFGMASLGFLSVFKAIDKIPGVGIERIFTDTKKTDFKVSELDVMGFSFSFELDFLSVFKIMEKYKIPFLSNERGEDYPLVYGGGPVLSSNPEPFAPIFDFIMVGDAEDNLSEIVETIKNNKNRSKKDILELLSKVQGVYVPSFTEFDVEKNLVTKGGKEFVVEKETADLPECIATPILSEESYFSNTYIIEIARGCAQKCGFCLASYLNLPARFCPYEKIIENIDFGLKHTNKLALLGALISAHPRFDDICDYIVKKIDAGQEIQLTVSSLRADYISPKTIEMLVKCGQKTATIAIEAGSDRLRKVINKNLSEDEIIESIRIASENGLQGFKIYAMIGLPTETYDDLHQLIELTKKIKKLYKRFDISFSFATFVPKAQTPFQYAQREDTKSLEAKYQYLKKEFHKIGVKISCSSVKWDYIQSVFSRGDRRLAEYAIEVYRQGCNLGAFKSVYKQFSNSSKLPNSDYYAIYSRDLNSNLPWDFIKLYKCKSGLQQEFQRLIKP